jgi:hypothetical protein
VVDREKERARKLRWWRKHHPLTRRHGRDPVNHAEWCREWREKNRPRTRRVGVDKERERKRQREWKRAHYEAHERKPSIKAICARRSPPPTEADIRAAAMTPELEQLVEEQLKDDRSRFASHPGVLSLDREQHFSDGDAWTLYDVIPSDSEAFQFAHRSSRRVLGAHSFRRPK